MVGKAVDWWRGRRQQYNLLLFVVVHTLSGKNSSGKNFNFVGEKFRRGKMSSGKNLVNYQKFRQFSPTKNFKLSSFSIQISVNLVSQNKRANGWLHVTFLSRSRRFIKD